MHFEVGSCPDVPVPPRWTKPKARCRVSSRTRSTRPDSVSQKAATMRLTPRLKAFHKVAGCKIHSAVCMTSPLLRALHPASCNERHQRHGTADAPEGVTQRPRYTAGTIRYFHHWELSTNRSSRPCFHVLENNLSSNEAAWKKPHSWPGQLQHRHQRPHPPLEAMCSERRCGSAKEP